MLPGNFQAAAAVLLAVVPGFIATTAWARAKTWRGPGNDLRTVLQSLALSAVVQVTLAPLTIRWLYPVRKHLVDYPARIVVWSALAVLVLPIVGGIAAGKITDALADYGSPNVKGRFRRLVARMWPAAIAPSIWDWLFDLHPPDRAFLVVEFKDGSRKAGVFARGSFAITSPERQGVYLVSEWELDDDGNVVGPIPATGGIMILDVEGIRSVRVLESHGDKTKPS